MNKIAAYWKGILAFISPGVTLLVVAVTDASPGGTSVTGAEWVGIGAAMVVTGGVVTFGPSNKAAGVVSDQIVDPELGDPNADQ